MFPSLASVNLRKCTTDALYMALQTWAGTSTPSLTAHSASVDTSDGVVVRGVLREDAQTFDELLPMVLRETNAAKILRTSLHPNIAAPIALFENELLVGTIVPATIGDTLEDVLLRDGLFHETRVRKLALDMINAIAHLHTHGIVHNAIAPENFVLAEDGLKLVDFSMSLRVGVDAPSLLGIPDFMAPEVILAKPVVQSSDFWSLGVTVYELLMGAENSMFLSNDPKELVRKILHDDLDLLTELSPDCSKAAQDFVRRLVTRDVSARLGSIVGGDAATTYRASDVLAHPFLCPDTPESIIPQDMRTMPAVEWTVANRQT